MSTPTIVSGFSSNEYYTNCYTRFKRMFYNHCKNKLLVQEYEDTGNWHNNTRKKPEIILKFLEQEKETIMWIDIDAEIYNPIEINIPLGIDMMATRQEWGPRRTWCVGTMVFNYTENSINMLKDWADACVTGKGTDEANLDKIWNEKWKTILKTEVLPKKFFMVDKLHIRERDTVILHKSSGNARRKETL